MELKQPEKALEAYQADLEKHPNRYNGLQGAAQAAAQCQKQELADYYNKQLKVVTAPKTAIAKKE